MTQAISVKGLYCYPVKSCRGVSLGVANIGPLGIKYDRQWMFIDEDGNFIAQRGDPKTGTKGIKSMCMITTCITRTQLILSAPNMPDYALPLIGMPGILRDVRVWDSFCTGIDQGDEAAQWATKYLSREIPDDGIRKSKNGNGHLAFGDGYPFLILSQGSLDDLNSKLEEKLPVNRFRPNILLTGCEPYAEDTLPDFKIGNVQFIGMNTCVRCPITTINQLTGEHGKEPLKTLATYRRTPEGVIFARNFNHSGVDTICIGDTLVFQ